MKCDWEKKNSRLNKLRMGGADILEERKKEKNWILGEIAKNIETEVSIGNGKKIIRRKNF